MGLKHRTEDKEEEERGMKVYGCEMPKIEETRKPYEVAQYPIPEIYKESLNKPKSNTFGLGYIGLDKSHVNLFQSTNLVVKERGNKKLSITGQAFGVGAFEDEDEDIYSKDNMSKYDFELTSEAATTKSVARSEENSVFGLFKLAQEKLSLGEHFPPPVIPQSFSGKHNVKKSRFEPLPEEKAPVIERKQIDANVRARHLGEDTNKIVTPSGQQHVRTHDKNLIKLPEEREDDNSSNITNSIGGFNLLLDKFVSGAQVDSQDILEPVKPTENLHGTKEMRDAASMKMFGPLTRITFDWQPSSLLCKRFNVPEPNCAEDSQKNKKRTKQLIFEYQKETEMDLGNKAGLIIQKKEVEERLPESATSQMEIVQEASTSREVVIDESDTVPKIETSAPIDLTEKVDVAKNTDLFKAIFLDTSESESEEEKEKEEDKSKSESFKDNVLSESLLPKIKTKQSGILSNIDFSQMAPQPNMNLKPSDNYATKSKDSLSDDLSYGPKVPQTRVNACTNLEFRVDESNDDWVEKGTEAERKNTHRHKKKNKKEKYEHKKKHKHKHDKKRK